MVLATRACNEILWMAYNPRVVVRISVTVAGCDLALPLYDTGIIASLSYRLRKVYGDLPFVAAEVVDHVSFCSIIQRGPAFGR